VNFPATLAIPPEVLGIARKLEAEGFETWCVGGAIRDNLLGEADQDFDLATAARPEEVQRVFPRTVPVGIEHGTVAVLDRQHRPHEVTTFRRDVRTDGRHAEVEFGVSLQDDLARRDFTINAIAYHPLRHEWRDPFDGAADLDKRVIRAVGDPNWRFQEDYLRILRALRFSARFDFRIQPRTRGGEGERPGPGPALGGTGARRVVQGGADRAAGVAAVRVVAADRGGADLAAGDGGEAGRRGPGPRPAQRGPRAARPRARVRVPRERRGVALDPAEVLEPGHRAQARRARLAGPLPRSRRRRSAAG
jgi:hypothetical protein